MTLVLPTERNGLLSPEWLAESVRVTLFTEQVNAPVPLWETLVGSRPTEVNERPGEGIRVEVGDFNSGALVVTQQGNRRDILFNARADFSIVEQITPPRLIHLGPATSAILAMFSLLNKSPSVFENALRVAFAPTFVRLGPSSIRVNQYITEGTHMNVSSTDTDIIWQVNRRISAKSFHGVINRIVNWQSSTLQMITLFGAGRAGGRPQEAEPVNFARVTFDINTIQTQLPFVVFDDPQAVMSEVVETCKPMLIGQEVSGV